MLASYPKHSNRHSSFQLQHQPQTLTIPQHTQHWSSTSSPALSNPQPQYNSPASNIFAFGHDQPVFDYQAQDFHSTSSQSLMQPEHSNNSWFEHGQLTPRSATRAHHRESSLSSLGSAGPSSPYTATTSNPHVAGDLYDDFGGYHHHQPSSKPLTPAHTPSQEDFLTPHYSTLYHTSQLSFPMGHDGLPKTGDADLMPAPEFNHSGRPSVVSVASGDSPSTPPSYEEERQRNAYRTSVPKLARTMTDVYADELYSPSFHLTAAAPTSGSAVNQSPQNHAFARTLQLANNQHMSASQVQTPLSIPSRERSPFRQGSPLAPTGGSFGVPPQRFSTATAMRQQQKAVDDRRALEQQMSKASPEQVTPKTISPKDVDLVYHETEEDANTPLFPHSQPPNQLSVNYGQPPANESSEVDDSVSQRSYGSMATTRRESSSAYSASSQAPPNQSNYSFTTPAMPGVVRQVPQQYPFVPQPRRQPSNLSNVSEEFPATLVSMESSSSEYAPDSSETLRPASTTADTGTYTCTYHGCTLRFDSPAKLQRHKREGHRNSAAVISGGEEGGMTSAAQRNSQAGPHKCERINPSTGKPCNTIFSRPYDLTRHEDTIHNARKQKVHCPYCTEEKTFSRNDALTRHLRVVHPDQVDSSKNRRRGGAHD